MARKRDYRKEYARRDTLARAKGYKSYYDYRLHRHGKEPPATRPAKGRERERLAGRRGVSKLFGHLEEGNVEMLNLNVARFGPEPQFDVLVTLDDGTAEEYKIRGDDQARRFFAAMEDYPDVEPPALVGSPKAIQALQTSVGA